MLWNRAGTPIFERRSGGRTNARPPASELLLFGLLVFLILIGPTVVVSESSMPEPPHATLADVRPKMQASLNIFSGRPDPHWLLNAAETEILLQKVQSLDSTVTDLVKPEELGYRGISVRSLDPGATNFVELTAFRNIVWVTRVNGDVHILADKSNSIEVWLLGTAGPHLPSDLLDYAAREIKRWTPP